MRILDLFAGIGWGCALESLGLSELGIDNDADVCATRELHGWPTLHVDITTVHPDIFDADVLIASPPCQSFSTAGKRLGLADERGQLVWQVERWALALRPRVIVCEQVPAVLPIWRLIGSRLAAERYSWWAGCLDAVQWGVPQTRKRAILVARRDGLSPLPPAPTHNPYRKGVAADAGPLLPWVSMADALGWGGFEAHHVRGAGMTELHPREWVVDLRQSSPRGDGTRDLKVSPIGAPAPMLGTQSASQWQVRPSTTITGERVSLPGHHYPAVGHSSQYGPDPIKLTIEQGLTLQSFPADFALAGSKTSQWRQIGNSVAPRFAGALLAHVLDSQLAERAMT